MFKLHDKVRNKYTKVEGYIDAIPGGDRYRVRTKDGYEWMQWHELEFNINKTVESKEDMSEAINKIAKKKTDLRYLG
jgi:hypothetical protein